jgi:hypothetical protein
MYNNLLEKCSVLIQATEKAAVTIKSHCVDGGQSRYNARQGSLWPWSEEGGGKEGRKEMSRAARHIAKAVDAADVALREYNTQKDKDDLRQIQRALWVHRHCAKEQCLVAVLKWEIDKLDEKVERYKHDLQFLQDTLDEYSLASFRVPIVILDILGNTPLNLAKAFWLCLHGNMIPRITHALYYSHSTFSQVTKELCAFVDSLEIAPPSCSSPKIAAMLAAACGAVENVADTIEEAGNGLIYTAECIKDAGLTLKAAVECYWIRKANE